MVSIKDDPSSATDMNRTVEEAEIIISTFVLDIETFYAIEAIVGVIILPSISVFGIFANVANIVVYVKMGFQETTNIMFLALSSSDLVILTNYFVSTFGGNGVFNEINTLFWNMWDMVLVLNPITWAFIGYGACITALIAVERSVCIAFPLKVKTIFTPGRITVAVFFFLGFVLASLVQRYAMMNLRWVTSLATNETRLVFSYTKDNVVLDHVANVVFSTLPSCISFVTVAVGTAFMVAKLNRSAQWRATSAQVTQKKAVSTKEVRVVRSVVLVCSLFIVCFTPNALIIITGLVYPRFHVFDPYFNPFLLTVYNFSHIIQAVSSSVNIFIYLSTSTKYKKIFLQTFFFQKRPNNAQ